MDGFGSTHVCALERGTQHGVVCCCQVAHLEITTTPYTGYKCSGQGSTLLEPLMMYH